MDAFPDIIDLDSGDSLSVDDLAEGEVYLNESAADELNAREGDGIQVFIENQPHEFTVKALVEDTGAAGAIDFANQEGLVTNLSTAQELFSQDEVTVILVSATGGVRTDLAVVDQVEVTLADWIRELHDHVLPHPRPFLGRGGHPARSHDFRNAGRRT
jgi:hypothetical protein